MSAIIQLLGGSPVRLVRSSDRYLCDVSSVHLPHGDGEGDQDQIGVRLLEGHDDEPRAGVVDHQTDLHRAWSARADDNFTHDVLSANPAPRLGDCDTIASRSTAIAWRSPPPSDAFAYARFRTIDWDASPASHAVAGTVARWRERDARDRLPVLDLGMYPIVENAPDPAGFFNALCGLTGVGIFTLLGIGMFAAHLAGRF